MQKNTEFFKQKNPRKIIKKALQPIFLFFYNQILGAKLNYPHFDTIEIAVAQGKEWRKSQVTFATLETCTSSLDVGCGTNPRNPFSAKRQGGVDIIKNKKRDGDTISIKTADLSSGILPFEDSEFDYVTAFDFIEHLSRQNFPNSTLNPFVQFMNEVNRVLKPGGVFLSHTPAFPFESAFSDPTHQNIITENTFPYYFACHPTFAEPWARMYGFNGDLKMITQYWMHDHLISVLGKK